MVVAAFAAVLVAAPVVRPPSAAADTGDIGYQDQSFSGTQDPTGTKRAESLLWFNDGSWWASMWDVVSGDFHIFRLDGSTQSWINTGVTLITDKPASGVDSEDTTWGLDNCWG